RECRRHLVAARVAARERRHRPAARRPVLDGSGEHDPLRRPHPRRDPGGAAGHEQCHGVRAHHERARYTLRRARAVHGRARQRVRSRNAARTLHRCEVAVRRFLTIPILAAAACSSPAIPSHDVQLASSGAGNPTVAVDEPSRLAYAAWVESNDVYLAVIDSTGNRTTVRVNDIPGDAAPHDQAPPQVALGPDRAVYVVWQNNTEIPGRRFPASNLRFARSLDGGRTFEPAIFVNDDAHDIPASHTFQDIAVADDGTILVSWIDGRARAQAELDGT